MSLQSSRLRFATLKHLLMSVCAVFALLCRPVLAAPPNPVVVGHARFTVVTPLCIRMEYSASDHFVDQRSLFAVGRQARFNGFHLTQQNGMTVIDTGVIHLVYTPDSRPFSPQNLEATISHDGVTAHWTPGASNGGNLGGTIRTLDGAVGPEDLGQGLISRDGWFLLDDSTSPLLTSDWVEARPADAGTDWYLFGYGDDYQAALKTLAVISGPVPLPRKYLLGTWYSRYWPYSEDEFRQIVMQYGQHDFPLDNIVMDMDWHKAGWTGWSWNRALIPHPRALLQWYHQQGLHDTLNLHPADGVGPQEDYYAQFMRDMGADPASGKTIPFDAANKKYMDTLFQDIVDPLEQEGVDFWWLDWQQYEYTRSIPTLTNLFWLNTLLYRHTAQNGLRGVSFSRWAGWGDQRHPIHFSGDANTGFPMLAFEVPFTSTAGNVGCFFWSHDIGGHMGGRNEESYTRWVQFGATSPVLRSHSTRDPTTDRRPWLYPTWATNSMRIAFHLRDMLFPYIYSSAWETCQQTIPLDRPMYIDYPKTEAAYHQAQQYFFGDNLLAAPIVTAGVGPGHVSHQTVWFPAGQWYNYFTGERYNSSGNLNALVSADINEFPLYVRGGVPLPMRRYTPRMGTAPLNTLVVRCYPGPDGQRGMYTLYEDDGQTQAYKHGSFALTPLAYARHGNTITVTVGAAHGTYRGQPTRRGLIFELPDTSKATNARVNGRAVPVAYDAVTETNRVTLPPNRITQPTTLTLQAAPADVAALHRNAVARRMAGVTGQRITVGPLKTMLAQALSQTKDASAQAEVLATAGVGLVTHSMAPYLYGGTTEDQFFAPAGLLRGNTVTLASGKIMSIVPGSFLNASGPTVIRRGKAIMEAGQVTFTMGGQTIQQPAALPAPNALLSPANITATATVTASGSEGGYSPEGAVDGILGGYPNDKSQEWSAGATVGAWLRLDWTTPQTVSRITLYDRPNLTDQVTSGTLTFSDGTTLPVGPLPNDGQTGVTVNFPAKTITWIKFTVTGVAPGTQNAGLSEIAVYHVK